MELTAGYYKVDYYGSIIIMEYVEQGPRNIGMFVGTTEGKIITCLPNELFNIIKKVL